MITIIPRLAALAAAFVACTYIHAATIYVNPGDDIQLAINQASPGDRVQLKNGTHVVSQPFILKSDIQFVGESHSAVLDASAQSSAVIIKSDPGIYLENLTLWRFTAKNLGFNFKGSASHIEKTNITLNNVHFYELKAHYDTAFITFGYGDHWLIRSCKFFRYDGNYPGRGVQFYKTHNATLETSTAIGYFKTALNITAKSTIPSEAADLNHRTYNTLVEDNTFMRYEGNYIEDHGIYAIAFVDLTIRGNLICNWSVNASGGAIKARNAEDLLIENNTFDVSGVRLYTYEDQLPHHLKDVVIRNNTITMFPPAPGDPHDQAILYWRRIVSSGENSIRVEGNHIENGSIDFDWGGINVADFNANGGGVFNNVAADILLKPGIANSGNTIQ